ncbi:hypothetical protein AB0J63_14130 [Streptosporangium canum]
MTGSDKHENGFPPTGDFLGPAENALECASGRYPAAPRADT